MESLGEKLKTAREARGFNYDDISRETNISVKYLDALEKEDFSIFPGEPYLLGFLKNYGEYLGLDSDELLPLYRSLKIQEQPVPMEQLLKKPSPVPKILKGAAVVLAIAGVFSGVFYFVSRLPQRSPEPPPSVNGGAEYTMTDFLERRFYPGDSVLVSGGADSYKLIFTGLGDAVTITTPRGPVTLDLSREVTVDLNNDGTADLKMIAADFVKNDSEAGALLRFEYTAAPETAEVSPGIPLETFSAGQDVPLPNFTSPSPYPFTLQAVFQGYCFFRHEIIAEPDKPGRTEQYYQRSEEISISAQNGIRLGISNAQAVKLQVIGGSHSVPLETGGAGEVVAAELHWVRAENNTYRLVLTRLE